jgi:type II secretory pathway pseudopilin PulG
MKPKKSTRNSPGFTLIELLVIIAIIGLLAGVVALAVASARTKSRDAKRIADVRQMLSAMENYYNDSTSYPTGTGYVAPGGAQLGTDPLSAIGYDGNTYDFIPKYIGTLPSAPSPADGSCAESGIGGNNYWYEADAPGTTYTLTFCLGKDTGDFLAGTHFASPQGIQ